MRSGFVIHSFAAAIKIRFKKNANAGAFADALAADKGFAPSGGFGGARGVKSNGHRRKGSPKYVVITKKCKHNAPETTLNTISSAFGIAFEQYEKGA